MIIIRHYYQLIIVIMVIAYIFIWNDHTSINSYSWLMFIYIHEIMFVFLKRHHKFYYILQ